jgi:glycerol-3-phosphate cytidylyltransferase-like family protein
VDTRDKILEAPRLEFARPLVVVTGYFDVLRAGHARDLQRAREEAGAATLLAIVLPSPTALLPQRARAELVAALRAVDCVMMTDAADAKRLIGSLQPAHVVHGEAADQRRARELHEHVRSRCRNA